MRSVVAIVACVIGLVAVAACGRHPRAEVVSQGVTVVGPGSHDFGTVLKGMSSAPVAFTISPASGLQEDTVTAVTGCAGFVVDAKDLPAQVFQRCIDIGGQGYGGGGYGAPCTPDDVKAYTFTVTFAPIVAGFTSCDIVVGGTSPQLIHVFGTGALPDHLVSVHPPALQFGEIRAGALSSDLLVTITNVGALPLTVSSIATTNAAFSLAAGSPPVHQLAVGEEEEIRVRCRPPSVGAFSGAVEVRTNDPANGGVTAVQLACTGVTSNLDASPTSATLATRVGVPASTVLSLRNLGTGTTLGSVTLRTDSDPGLSIVGPPPNTPLGIGGMTTIAVTYDAATPASFAPTLGTIVVKSSTEPDRSITISGEALEVEVASQPMTTLDFGPICANVRSSRRLAVYAQKAGFVTVDGFEEPAGFMVTPLAALPQVARRNRLNEVLFDVAVMPTDPGELAGTLVIRTDAPLQRAYEVALKADVQPLGVSAAPSRLEFGATPVHGLTAATTVALVNCNTIPLAISGSRLEGAVDDFKVTRPASLAGTLMPAEKLEIDVIMSPQQAGKRTAQLIVEHADGGTTVIDLRGDGTGGDDGAPDRESYYACSTTHTSFVFPAVALVFALRRRRRV